MDILNYVLEEGLIVIPALYILAEIIKGTGIVKNKWIPAILLVISLVLTPLIVTGGYTADNIIQAILVAGATVFGNELITQSRKDE